MNEKIISNDLYNLFVSLVEAGRDFRNTAIVDDDFPYVRDKFDSLLTRAAKELKDEKLDDPEDENYEGYEAGVKVVVRKTFHDAETGRTISGGTTDTIESVSSDHHGGLQINLQNHGRGWSKFHWKKVR